MMKSNIEIRFWWQVIAALPNNRDDHAYYALRRVWMDHTIGGARSFYRFGTEDNITSSLFQNWALFHDATWVAALVRASGGSVGTVKRVRWAYECAEILDAKLRPFHGRDFVIPDLMLEYEDENGLGLLVIEAKKPGTSAATGDSRKLKTYIDLPRTRTIGRRQGCLLVSQKAEQSSNTACNGEWPILTWERLGELQVAAATALAMPSASIDRVINWIARHFVRNSISIPGPTQMPPPSASTYGSKESYRAIEALSLPDSVERFLKGSECVEAAWRGEQAVPPLAWLVDEPSIDIIRKRKWQTSPDRYVCRWNFDWSRSQERTRFC